MRILQIRLQNLNSLYGEWQIDLNDPAYAAAGIFAITGPTGAGKSTILDAICLALYGRTPRLGKLAKGGNEIMSRLSGVCFAEVTFMTSAGHYRCHWSQRRARGKAGGELQMPKHEIADALTGKIFESKLRGVAAQIEAITGMDFERFTRSMLLAQGEFAAFLQAGADERAPVLEQITGTEIYSRISMHVHERHSLEQNKLNTLIAGLSGITVLDDETRQQLENELHAKRRAEADLAQQIAANAQALSWLDGMAQLEQERCALALRQHDCRARHDQFAPAREKWQRALKAQELAANFAEIASISHEQQEETRQLQQSQAESCSREQACRQANERLKQAEEALNRQKQTHQADLSVIRQVRELDVKIGEKMLPLKAAEQTLAQMQAMHGQLQQQQQAAVTARDHDKKALEEIEKQLGATQADRNLQEQLAAIDARCIAWQEVQRRLLTKNGEIEAAQAQSVAAAHAALSLAQESAQGQRNYDSMQALLANQKAELTRLLDGQPLTRWRAHLLEQRERAQWLGQVDTALRIAEELRNDHSRSAQRQAALVGEAVVLAEQLQGQGTQVQLLEQQLALLENQLTLLQKIRSFDEARQQLQDGEPCPLCGSGEHPFARGNIPQPDETKRALSRARTDLKKANHVLAAQKIRQAELGKDQEQIAARIADLNEWLSTAQHTVAQGCAALAMAADDPHLPQSLLRLRAENGGSLERAQQIVAAAEALETAMALQMESLQQAREVLAKQVDEAHRAAFKRDLAQQQWERLQQEQVSLTAQWQAAQQALQGAVAVYDIDTVFIDSLAALVEGLTQRRDAWLARQNSKTDLERRVTTIQLAIDHRAGQMDDLLQQLQQQRASFTRLQQEWALLRDERHRIFGERRVDEEEASLQRQTDNVEQALVAAQQAAGLAQQAMVSEQRRGDDLKKTLAARALRLHEAEKLFDQRLPLLGFANHADYLSACLSEEERAALAQRAQQLADEQAGLAAQEQALQKKWVHEQQKALSTQPRALLEQETTALDTLQRESQQALGALQQRLQDDQALQLQYHDRSQAIAAQKQECTRWRQLYELIGSADGKKYRNFAQGLTFAVMIDHANRQLRKMNSRYWLIQGDEQPLQLNVIDHYQAGEIRSTKNLSGGESFIVSLALALGLAQMASRNVRVDSLFLDEGFGTLDEEALDTALDTLAGLQQDGKLIGIISHVPALNERLGVQIRIVPLAGGQSRIEGPGCRRIAL